MSNRAFSRSRGPSRGAHRHPVEPPSAPQPRQGRILRPAAAAARFGHYLARPFTASGPVLFTIAVLAGLYYTWIHRDEALLTSMSGLGAWLGLCHVSILSAVCKPVTPEHGAGYWFGIIGGTMMLVLLLYPLRKRVHGLRSLGKIPSWFRWHMILGVIGPALIVIHSNWKLESTNATVATVAMLIVVASGVIGRYLYAKVHKGLYGRKTEIRQILGDASMLQEALGEDVAQTGQLTEALRDFEARILSPSRSLIGQLWVVLTFGIRRSMARGRLLRLAKQTIAEEGRARGWSWGQQRKRQALVRQHLRLYFAATSSAASFAIFERMFALWHVLHMPLFFLLIIAAIIHILAVHLY